MNQNYFVKCGVCGAGHRVRIQAGYLNCYPVRFYCGECGSRICGEVRLDPSKAKVDFVLDRSMAAFSCDEYPESAYLVECSGELLTKKMYKQQLNILSLSAGSNPFFEAIRVIGLKKLDSYISKVVDCLEYYEHSWESVFRAMHLFIVGNKNYALDQIAFCESNIFSEHCMEEMQFEERVDRLFWLGVPMLASEETFERAIQAKSYMQGIESEKIKELCNYQKTNGEDARFILGEILDVVDSFASHFSSLIPAFTYQLSVGAYNLNTFGTNSCTLEDIRSLYCDAYELMGRLVCILIGLDNIIRDQSFDAMPQDTAGLPKDYSKLKGVAKGMLLKLLMKGPFIDLLNPAWSTDLRNAFSHKGFKIDSKKQLIQIIEKDGTIHPEKNLWLIDAMCQCVEMVRNLCVCWEIVYCLGLIGAGEDEI